MRKWQRLDFYFPNAVFTLFHRSPYSFPLSFFPFVYLSYNLSTWLSLCLFVFLCIYLSPLSLFLLFLFIFPVSRFNIPPLPNPLHLSTLLDKLPPPPPPHPQTSLWSLRSFYTPHFWLLGLSTNGSPAALSGSDQSEAAKLGPIVWAGLCIERARERRQSKRYVKLYQCSGG